MSKQGTRNLDIHLTRLATWIITTIGKAILWATAVAVVVAVLAGVTGDFYLGLALTPVAASLTFGFVLFLSTAPFPADLED